MTITNVNAWGSTSQSPSWTLGFTPTTGNTLIFAMSENTSGALTAVVDSNSVALSKATGLFSAGNNCGAEIWYYTVPATPSNVLTPTWASSLFNIDLSVTEWHGSVATLTLDSAPTGTSGNSGSATGPSVTPLGANELHFQVVGANGPESVSALTAGWTAVGNGIGTGVNPGCAGYLIPGVGGAESCTFTLSGSNNWAAVGCCFKETSPPLGIPSQDFSLYFDSLANTPTT